MSRSITGKIKINSFADIIGGDDTLVTEVPLNEMHTFKNHPFRVIDDAKMDETVESIKKYGVLMPGIVRPRIEGGYEIVAGHRRKRACELAGLETMPVLIRNYSDDEAVIVMIDTNIQREDILPSEKARAYKMKYEAMKHQGTAGGSTFDKIGETAGENGKTVQRYISLSRLSDELLQCIDMKRISMRAGVELSSLNEKEQEWVYDVLSGANVSLPISRAAKLRELSKNKKLNREVVSRIIASDTSKKRSFVIKGEKLYTYFPEDVSEEEIEETIMDLLEKWNKEKISEVKNGGEVKA